MPTPNEPKMLTPDGLVNQLFDGAWKQNPSNPKLAAQQVISFLTNALLYSLASSKSDPIVFLTEALIDVVAATSGEDDARKEILKHISDMLIAAASAAPPPGDAPPAAAPVVGKP